LLGWLCALAATPAHAFDDATADRALQFSRQQLQLSATNPAIPTNRYPKANTNGTSWRLVENNNMIDWVQGFFPGLLWYMYDQGRDPFWKTKADAWTRPLEIQKTNTQTHDLGFKFMPSYGHAYRLTGDTYYRDVLLTAARSLATRYNSTVGVIDCCDWNDPDWQVPMVTDTMADLELLFWAARNGGDPAWRDMALRHALKTATDMVRADGGTWHVVDYSTSGAIRSKRTFQGYSNSSTWARGQAWAIYGFTMAYRYTRDARMLATAQKLTNYYLDRLPSDFVPNWDFNAPSFQKDSSAAAIVASALLELSTFVTDPAVAQRYRNAALAMLDSLSSPAYLAQGSTSPGILLHGTAFYRTPIKPTGEDIDKSLIYGDYYFVEALVRYKLQSAGGWYSTLDFPRSLHPLGTGNTGVRIIEFDVTPLSKFIDTIIGYADTSTSVTGLSRLAMAVRLNARGFFDVRGSTVYSASASVPYEALSTYHVRIRADLNAKTYSVWVTPPNSAEVLLADRFPFRSDAPATDDVGKVSLKSGRFDNEIRVRNHTVRAEGGVVEWASTLSWPGSVHDLGPGNTGIRTTEFDVIPLARPIDGVIGYADSSTTVTGYSSLAMGIRLNASGFFDVRQGGAYAALTQVPYSTNASYHVRMRTDLNAKTYSVWVTPPGGSEVLIADRFAFRSDAPPTDDLGKVAVKSGVTEAEFRVRGHTVRAEGTIATPEPVAPEDPPQVQSPPEDGQRLLEESTGGCTSAPGTAMAAAAGLLLWLLRSRRPRVSRR
jgi:unsaturated chondroitin disaccharide hydrolase